MIGVTRELRSQNIKSSTMGLMEFVARGGSGIMLFGVGIKNEQVAVLLFVLVCSKVRIIQDNGG